MSVYEFASYKAFVIHALEHAKGPGSTRKDLATALGCQPSHISGVLSGDGEFSPEQAEKAARFFRLGKEQGAYFVLLVQFNRAGTVQLRSIYESLLRTLREKSAPLRNKLEIHEELSDQDKARYYSSWIYQAIHVLLSVPGFQSPRAIAERLQLMPTKVDEVLLFLESAGLAEKSQATLYRQLRPVLHLDRSSVFLGRHHANWRLRALQAIDHDQGEDDLHYSGVVSLSEDDFLQIKRILGDALKAGIDVVRDSKEENIAAICMDFFKL